MEIPILSYNGFKTYKASNLQKQKMAFNTNIPYINTNINQYSSAYNISFGKTETIKADRIPPGLKIILDDYKDIPQVRAIAIGGSSQGNYADNSSDIDVYVFTDEDIPVEQREKIAKKYSTKYDVGQDYFGPDDEYHADALDKDIDIVYFDTNWFENSVENVWDKHNASNGYTTCFLYTLKNSNLIYDKDHWLKGLKDRINTPYPPKLKENITNRNLMLLKDKPFASYFEQIQKAINRGDENSVNHRISAFMASYFDIIFAQNELLHPGEKRLVRYAIDNCKTLPNNFEKNIKRLYNSKGQDIISILEDMVNELKKVIDNSCNSNRGLQDCQIAD